MAEPDGSLHRQVAWTILRVLVSVAALLAVYFWLPLDRYPSQAAITVLIVGLVLLIVLVAWQVRQIVMDPRPRLRAIEALATTGPLFLILFASTYFEMARFAPHSFSAPLTRADALYFTVTVFSTVGFGDITAKTQTARLVVTGQMIADIVFLGLGLKVIVGAVSRGRQRRRPRDSEDNRAP
ncbi:potassium channel family protein [Actinoplanes sp. KI2]|uniref:potassium channel family protein n=1 Tax=Actinoplanes sp. KI2 TaxID=2983315 RepID=UPI0021D5C442|nr:potassium channel family protein [Actinoplanes sp. KI2]MCU7727565.1 potassium channel family protein [Actinoplanes sp. KI2]